MEKVAIKKGLMRVDDTIKVLLEIVFVFINFHQPF